MHPPGVSSHLFDDIICKLHLITKYYDSTRLYTLSYTCIFFSPSCSIKPPLRTFYVWIKRHTAFRPRSKQVI